MARPLIVSFIKYFNFINVMDLLSTPRAGKRSIENGRWILESQCGLNLLSYSHSIEGRMAKTSS